MWEEFLGGTDTEENEDKKGKIFLDLPAFNDYRWKSKKEGERDNFVIYGKRLQEVTGADFVHAGLENGDFYEIVDGEEGDVLNCVVFKVDEQRLIANVIQEGKAVAQIVIRNNEIGEYRME